MTSVQRRAFDQALERYDTARRAVVQAATEDMPPSKQEEIEDSAAREALLEVVGYHRREREDVSDPMPFASEVKAIKDGRLGALSERHRQC